MVGEVEKEEDWTCERRRRGMELMLENSRGEVLVGIGRRSDVCFLLHGGVTRLGGWGH